MSKIHECSICHREGLWDDNWRAYGSMLDEESGSLVKMCSKRCRGKAIVQGIEWVLEDLRNKVFFYSYHKRILPKTRRPNGAIHPQREANNQADSSNEVR